jgi:ubiquinone/menaquinone biosynthesis C-methylase UbiE
MRHLSSTNSCCHPEPAKARRLPRVAAALGLVALGAGISLHLLANHFSYWWLPLVVLLVLAHGAIIIGIAWVVTRHRRNKPGVSAAGADHEHGGHSHTFRNPRAYDWLAQVITLGGERKFRRRTLDLAQLQPGDAVLDVGCGTGTLLIEAAKRVGPSGSTHGIDGSIEMLAHARRKAAAQGITAIFVEASAERLPFPDVSFDVVLCTMMLHHLPVPMQIAAVVEMRRVLRPGGRIVIVDIQRTRTISAVFSPMGLLHVFHQFSSRATTPDWQKIEELMMQQGAQLADRRAIWGETVSALVGRIASSTTSRQVPPHHRRHRLIVRADEVFSPLLVGFIGSWSSSQLFVQ